MSTALNLGATHELYGGGWRGLWEYRGLTMYFNFAISLCQFKKNI